MNKYFLWIILAGATGNPLLAALMVLAFWYFFDRFTLRVLPDPVKAVMRRFRAWKLQDALRVHPHDRRARLELGGILVGWGRYAQAVEVLRPNLEAGDDDVDTLFVAGQALCGAGQPERAEVLFQHVEELKPNFRLGEIDLTRGRLALARKDYSAAKSALERLVKTRSGTVEGRVLLARAVEGLGDAASAKLLRADAWREHANSPRFQQRAQRFWAWRANPARPLMYAAALGAFLFLFGRFVAPSFQRMSPAASRAAAISRDDE